MADISIIGLGMIPADHLTPESQEALRKCNEVLFVDTTVGTEQFLAKLCPNVTPIFDSAYQPARNRLNAYQYMAARVIDAALGHAPVAFAMPGHPTVGAYAPFLIADAALVLELTVHLFPGVSAMDCMFAELMIDPCIAGCQMYEATDMLLRRRPLQPDVPAMIWQVGCVESRLYSMRVSAPARFQRLRNHLLQFYPARHVATLHYSSPHPLMRSTSRTFAIGDLCDHAHEIHAGFTLLIPSAYDRPISDPELRAQIDSAEHLESITR